MSEIITGAYPEYILLHGKLKNLVSIIKNTANSAIYNKNSLDSDKVNTKNFFDTSFDILFPSFNDNGPASSYDTATSGYTIASGTISDNNLLLSNNSVIFKNTLANSINLKIDQTIAAISSAGVLSNSNDLLTSFTSATKMQHLFFYNNLSGTNNITQNLNNGISRNIYYTIFLLDVYIKIVEAFINSNILDVNNENYWDYEEIAEIIDNGSGGSTGYSNTASYSDYSSIITHANLVKTASGGSAASFRRYKNIHIVYEKLYDSDNAQNPSGKWVTVSDNVKQVSKGIYLYIGDEFKDVTITNAAGSDTIYKYFKSDINVGQTAVSTIPLPVHNINKKYTFMKNSSDLDNFSTSSSINKYIYKEFLFDNEASGDFTDAKKPYQKQIRIFLVMIRNIKYQKLKQTLHYLLIYLKCLKSLLLTSIRSINIYFNLAWSLTNCLALNCPIYKDPKYKFIKYLSIHDNGSTDAFESNTEIGYKTVTPEYIKNSYVYRLISKDAASTTESFKKILNDIDNNIYQHIYGLNESIPLSITSLDKYGFNNNDDGLLYTKFYYTAGTYTISPHMTGSSISTDTGSLPISETFIKLKNNLAFPDNYILTIPSLGIRAKITKISVNTTDNKYLDLKIANLEGARAIPASFGTNAYIENVYVIPRSTFDIEKNIINLKNNIDRIDENINSNKTKILNNTSLYESHKSKNKMLYDQLIAYIVIVSFVVFVLLTINVANVEKPLLKIITLVCFGIIIILISVYYIIKTIYIDENYVETFTVVNQDIFNDICRDCTHPSVTLSSTTENSPNTKMIKKNKVSSILKSNAKTLSTYIDLALLHTDSQTLYNKEAEIEFLEKNRHDSKNYANYVLEHKKDDAFLNMDVVKYENANYNVYILSMLLLFLVLIGAYTINIYTENRYIDVISLITIILLICIFTYYIININKIVRTISSNYYWGREFSKTYEKFNNPPPIMKEGVNCHITPVDNEKVNFNCDLKMVSGRDNSDKNYGSAYNDPASPMPMPMPTKKDLLVNENENENVQLIPDIDMKSSEETIPTFM